jgi:peptidoglycan/LPS O-acetylase OafA/YrhL
MGMNVTRKVGRIPSLDGWRAISIVLVLLSHEWATKGAPKVTYPLSIIFDQGSLGVRIFFVISGYLITHLMLREVSATGHFNLRQFYTRRMLRIFPVYFMFLTVLALMQFAGLFKDIYSSWLGALTFTRNMVGRGDSPTGHLWSLAVEEQFYLAWPIAFSTLALFRRAPLAIAILTAVTVGTFFVRLIPCSDASFVCVRLLSKTSALRFSDCLAVGCLGAFILDVLPERGWWHEARAINIIGFASTACLIFSTFITSDSTLSLSALVTGQTLLTMAAIYATTRGGVLAIPLNAPPVVVLGVISYSLYVWHMLFVADYLPGLAGIWIDDWRLWWIPALLLASISYYCYERRFIELRHRYRPAPLPSD